MLLYKLFQPIVICHIWAIETSFPCISPFLDLSNTIWTRPKSFWTRPKSFWTHKRTMHKICYFRNVFKFIAIHHIAHISIRDIFSLHFTIFGPDLYNLDGTRPKLFCTHKRTRHKNAPLEIISTYCDLPHMINRDIFSLHFFIFGPIKAQIMHKNANLQIISTHCDSPHMSNRDIFPCILPKICGDMCFCVGNTL